MLRKTSLFCKKLRQNSRQLYQVFILNKQNNAFHTAFNRRVLPNFKDRNNTIKVRFISVSSRCDNLVLEENDANNKSTFENTDIPSQAKVVICGGGLLGSSVAYHLAESGWTDVILLDQGRVGGDSSWTLHSSGILGQYKPSSTEGYLCRYSIELLKKLESEGHKTGWKQCGSLHLARHKDRITTFERNQALLEASGIECSILSPSQIEQRCSDVRTDDLKGGLWIPGDGVADPMLICLTLAALAKSKGVTVLPECKVTKVMSSKQRVTGIETNKGKIKCEYFINCGGIWAQEIGSLSDPVVKVPIHPVEQYYLHTKPVLDVNYMIPVIRDYDGHIYIRVNNGRFLAGGFDPVAKPISWSDVKNSPYLDEDWDHFHIMLEQILHRCPIMEDAVLDKLCNFPDGFTPDGKWILGESPEIENYFVAAGMKTLSVAAVGGVAKVLSNWVTSGHPQMDVWELDIRRFLPLHNNKHFLRDRVTEIPGNHSKISYPNSEFKTGRCIRMSPIYHRLKAAGAVFGQIMGYERPNYFLLPGQAEDNEQEFLGKGTFHKPNWFENVMREYKACRQSVAMVDYSSFTKLELWSRGTQVVDTLQYLCSNDVDIPIGGIVHTGMQNHLGGYENDCSLIRLASNRYMMIAPTIQQTRSQVWISRHLPSDGSVALSDVTSMYTAICIMGPNSSLLISDLTDQNINIQKFPFFTYKEFSVALACDIRVMNLTHTGELGWILYIPNEYALHVYDKLVEVGSKYKLLLAGNLANRTLRIERFYAYWGQDLDTMTTPFECGRDFRVKLDHKCDFIGKEALLMQRENGVTRRYIQLIIDEHDINNDPWPCGGEPIYLDGICVGKTTTTGYGCTLEKQVCLGFVQCLDSKGKPARVTSDYILQNTFYVNIAGRMFPAKANLYSKLLSRMVDDKNFEYSSSYLATQ
ncbi:Pyruvate dehydrogenase phosphatase regulatory subunit, mitochondrial [Nymphon striatum]|nr:Pyruvate dehydrogenase phosphatase regulatory subunit, mitochondrial [Nymphon striatum]